MTKFVLEICAGNLESANNAQAGGADRVELCAYLQEGGITPSYGVIKACRKVLTHTKLNVMIRPRGGDFLYSEDDLAVMVEDLKICLDLGVDGVVFGALTCDGEIDRKVLDTLMPLAQDLDVTFHRAFDLCKDPFAALDLLIDYKIPRLLTSGLRPKALMGADLIRKLNDKAQGKLKIMPGSGVNPQNLKELYEKTLCTEYHFSAKVLEKSKMCYRPTEDLMSGTYVIDEYDFEISKLETIKKAREVLDTLKL